MDSRLIFLHTVFVPMEGRRVVPNAAYWIAVGVLRRLDRQIRLILLRGTSKPEASAEGMLGSTLPRKTSKVVRVLFRTANRHRW